MDWSNAARFVLGLPSLAVKSALDIDLDTDLIHSIMQDMKGNYNKSQGLAEGAQQLLKILEDIKECDMNDAVRTALDCLVVCVRSPLLSILSFISNLWLRRTLRNIEEDMFSVAKCGRFKKLIQIKGNQEKIQDCTSRLGIACNAFQVCTPNLALSRS